MAGKEYDKLTIKEWAAADRPREKSLAKGIESLSNAELIAILLRTGNRNETAVSIAKRLLLLANNNLNELGRFSLNTLTRIKGIGEAKAITLLAAMELGRRRKQEEILQRPAIRSSSDVIAIFQPQLADLPHEEFWIMLLNRANRIIDRIGISRGGISGTIVDVRLIAKMALEKLSSGVILIHNHPSGNPEPSSNDIAITQKLKKALSLFDITLLDHIIVTGGECHSLADSGSI